jgi:uncharacterized membrane protein YhaH (DUF805 family)
MSFGEAIRSGFQRYTDFGGRSSRSEYWFWVLFTALASIGLGVLDLVIRTDGGLVGVFALVTFLPSLAVAVRRLHDIDRSGWWLLIGFVPLIGSIILIIWFATAGRESPNRYGRNPLTL